MWHLLLVLTTASAFSIPTTTSPWVREAEKKHGRVAMLAVPSLALLAMLNDGADPVPWLNAQPESTQLVFYASAAALESLNLRRFEDLFALKPGEEPGKLLPVEASETWHNAEDYVGRVSMLVATSILASSLTI